MFILGLLAMLVIGTGVLNASTVGTAKITSPEANSQIAGLVRVAGTATVNNFQFYKLEFGSGTAPSAFSVIGPLMTAPVVDDTLGSWDTSKVPDGQYALKLTVVDKTGNYVQGMVAVTVANNAPPAAPQPPNRGCTSCHVKVMPNGGFTLAFEAAVAAGEDGNAHPTKSPSGVSITPQDQTGPQPCLECHGAGSGARVFNGTQSKYSLRDIVHPAHLFSKIFTEEFTGNCFSCHNVDAEGEFDILSQKVDVNVHGVPQTIPIPGLLEPTGSN